MKRVLVASPDRKATRALGQCFRRDHEILTAGTGADCLKLFQRTPPDIMFIDVCHLAELGAGDDIAGCRNTLRLFWNIFPSAQIIVLCAQQQIHSAVVAVQAGASNYLVYPIDRREARYVVQTSIAEMRMQSELDYLRDQFWLTGSIDLEQTKSPLMREVFEKVRSVAPAETTVLITGEAGTGTGVIANLVHRLSARRERQFITVRCGAIPGDAVESELFGHERGAFAGAVKRKLGAFEIAQGGTLFLDDIDALSLPVQTRLLQVLEDRAFQRIGGEDRLTSDVRVIAASNVDLSKLSEQDAFNPALFRRLNVFPIELPPLRQRREDIPLLVEQFLHNARQSHLKRVTRVHPDVLRMFQEYAWPGNVRELLNLLERACLLETGDTLSPSSFPRELFDNSGTVQVRLPAATMTLAEARRRTTEEMEAGYLRTQLAAASGRINQTAQRAGITPRQLRKLLAKYGIRKEDYRRRTSDSGKADGR